MTNDKQGWPISVAATVQFACARDILQRLREGN
jgi:hypothetical protein